MKIQIGKNELLNGLKISEMTGVCKALPQTENYLINIEGSIMTIISTDLENDIIVNLDIQLVMEEITFLVNRKKLYSAINNIRSGILELNITDDTISIKSGVSIIKLAINSMIDEISAFPTIDFSANTPTYDTPKLAELLRIAINYTGNDDFRPTMKGVNFIVKNNKGTIASTDAHILYTEDFNIEMPDVNIIIPNSKIIKHGFSKIGFIEDKKRNNDVTHIIYQNDNFIYRSRLIDGKFPNFKAIIPQNNPNIVNLDKTALNASLNELKTTYTTILALVFKDNKIILKTENLEDCAETLSLINTNESNIESQFVIGCNLNFLQTCLLHLDTDIMINMSTESRPIILSDKNQNKIILIMPTLLHSKNVDFEEMYNEILGEVKNEIKIKSETIVEENINLDVLETKLKKKNMKKEEPDEEPIEELNKEEDDNDDDINI